MGKLTKGEETVIYVLILNREYKFHCDANLHSLQSSVLVFSS